MEFLQSVFDNLPDKELFKARTRSNPFETLGKLFFQNRAALKMANLDAVFDFIFTSPVDENGVSFCPIFTFFPLIYCQSVLATYKILFILNTII